MRDEIKICLDEIEASYEVMKNPKTDDKTISEAKGWVRKNKAILKELNYNGRIVRQPKIHKGKGSLFE